MSTNQTITAHKPYGCHNRTWRPTLLVRVGWTNLNYDPQASFTRTPVVREIPHTMSTTCHYDQRQNDARCTGCKEQT